MCSGKYPQRCGGGESFDQYYPKGKLLWSGIETPNLECVMKLVNLILYFRGFLIRKKVIVKYQ